MFREMTTNSNQGNNYDMRIMDTLGSTTNLNRTILNPSNEQIWLNSRNIGEQNFSSSFRSSHPLNNSIKNTVSNVSLNTSVSKWKNPDIKTLSYDNDAILRNFRPNGYFGEQIPTEAHYASNITSNIIATKSPGQLGTTYSLAPINAHYFRQRQQEEERERLAKEKAALRMLKETSPLNTNGNAADIIRGSVASIDGKHEKNEIFNSCKDQHTPLGGEEQGFQYPATVNTNNFKIMNQQNLKHLQNQHFLYFDPNGA